ncbi:MAG: TlpA family protein disulfide reductase [Bacteroidales bacterium]|jgi:peroxiredoxin|nr:TlpA family protein disulfide reductase [Bacteroidales bacterium]
MNRKFKAIYWQTAMLISLFISCKGLEMSVYSQNEQITKISNNQGINLPENFQADTFQFASDSARLACQYRLKQYFLANGKELMTPSSDMDAALTFYYNKCIRQTCDSIISEIDWLIQVSDKETVKNHYLNLLFSGFNISQHNYDEVMLYFYDTYSDAGECKWLESSWNRVFKNKVKRIRKLVNGAIVPTITACDLDGNLISSDSIKAKNLVLWFWDPDCSHCIEMTPPLYRLYLQLKTEYDVEILAISITDDYPRWKSFIDKYQLDWLNVSYAHCEPNYDFVDYFDLVTTPVIYLLDQSHRIVAHDFKFEELGEQLRITN